jgi:hypothetical protein
MGELYEVHRMLVVSTSHVTEQTALALPQTHSDLLIGDITETWWPTFVRDEGWVFHVPPEKEWFDERYRDAPKDLYTVLDTARQHECEWLMFDSDGPVVDHLPNWEW